MLERRETLRLAMSSCQTSPGHLGTRCSHVSTVAAGSILPTCPSVEHIQTRGFSLRSIPTAESLEIETRLTGEEGINLCSVKKRQVEDLTGPRPSSREAVKVIDGQLQTFVPTR